MSIGEFFRIKKRLLREQLYVIGRYYPKSFRFALTDLSLGFFSLFFNPYRICRKQGLVYGETPLSAFHRIAEICELEKSDLFLDLGAGRGKGCFWISAFVGCQTIGIEKVGVFVFLSRFLAALFGLPVQFQKKELQEADFSQATCIYLYGTCLSDAEIHRLLQKMSFLPPGARVLSISAPLPGWTYKTFPIDFPWGETEAFLHRKS